MTSPNIGSAEVDVNAYVDEKELANAARRAGRRAGDTAGDTFSQRFARRIRRIGNAMFATLTAAAGKEGAHSADEYGTTFVRQLRRSLLRVDRVAVETGRRFVRRFQSGLTRIRDFSLLDAAAVEIGARNAARRFVNAFRVRTSQLDGPDFDWSTEATAGGRSAASRFVEAFRRGFGRSRIVEGDVFSQVLGDQAEAERQAQAAGGRLGTRFVRGFRGVIVRVGDLISNLATPRFTGDPERDAEIAGRESANRFARGFRSALERTDLGRQIALDFDRRGFFGGFFRTGIRLAGVFSRGLLSLAGGGLKAFGNALSAIIRPFSRYIALAGLLTAVTVPLIPLIGRLANGLLEIVQGGLVAIPALLTAAAGTFAVFKAGARGLNTALTPLMQSFQGFNEQIDAVFLRGGIATAARRFASEQVPSIRRGLEQLAEGYSNFIAKALDAGAVARFGDALERSFTFMRGFLDNLAPGLLPLTELLGQMISQVSARLPRLGRELGEWFGRLRESARSVDFGEVFERGLRGAINLGKAIGTLTMALSDFFDAAVGGQGNTSGRGSQPFEGLLRSMRDLRAWVNENRDGIYGFFQGLERVVSGMWTGAKAAGRFIGDMFEPIKEYVQSNVFAERMERIGDALARFGEGSLNEGSVGQQVGDIIVGLADTILEDGPEIIGFLEDARDLFLEVAPAIETLADEADGLGTVFSALGAVAEAITSISDAIDDFDPGKWEDWWDLVTKRPQTAAERDEDPEKRPQGGFVGILPSVENLIENPEAFYTAFKTKLTEIKDRLVGMLPSIPWGDIGKAVMRLILGPFAAVFDIPADNLQSGITSLFGKVYTWATTLDWGKIARDALVLFTGPWAVPIIIGVGSFVSAIDNAWTAIKAKADTTDWAAIARAVVALFTGSFNVSVVIRSGSFTQALAKLFGDIMVKVNSIDWGSIGRSVISFFTNGFSGVPSIGGGLLSALSGLWSRASALAARIRGIDTSFGSGGGGAWGGSRANSSNPQGIGRRANGGLITRPEVSLIGEAGPELILPLTRPRRMQQLMREAGLTANSTRTTTVHAPITVMGGAGSDPLMTANLVSRKLMGKVR